MAKDTGMGFLERAAGILDIPAEAIADVPLVEISGAREVFIENHKGILEYSEDEVKVNTRRHILRIVGRGLTVNAMTPSQLKLCGDIEALQFVSL